jgi:hypothetical protein
MLDCPLREIFHGCLIVLLVRSYFVAMRAQQSRESVAATLRMAVIQLAGSRHGKQHPYIVLTVYAQVLVLSHEKATHEELVPYLQHRFRPIVPLVLYGRAASLKPPCHKQECVCYFWRDRYAPHVCSCCK